MKTSFQKHTVGRTAFGRTNSENLPLFRVSAGVPIEEALEQASCLMSCVLDLSITDSIEAGTGTRTWSAHYLSEMAKALIDDVSRSLHQSRAGS